MILRNLLKDKMEQVSLKSFKSNYLLSKSNLQPNNLKTIFLIRRILGPNIVKIF